MRSLLTALCLTLLVPAASAFAQDAEEEAPPVELIEAGAAPQRLLRHRFVAGQSQPVRLRVQSQMRMSIGTRVQMIPMPIMRMDIAFGPTEVTSEGHLRYAFRITDVGVSGGEREELNARVQETISGLIGANGLTEIDDHGTVLEFDYQLPDGSSAELQQQSHILREAMTRLLPRFPDEPVGVGARWRVTDDLPLPNMSVRVGTTYELTSWQGDFIEISVSTETVEGDGSDNRANVDVGGSGRLRFELGTLRMRGRVQTIAAAQIRGPQGEMRMRIRTRMQVSPN